MTEFAIYRGDEFLCLGTAEECAKYMGVKPGTIWHFTKPSYKRKRANSQKEDNIIVFKLGDDHEI